MEMKISQNQATLLVMCQGLGMFIVLAGFIASQAGRDGWMSIIIAFALGALITPLLIYVAKQFPDKTLIGYLPEVWGKFLGRFFSTIIILYLLILAAILFRGTTGNIKAMYINTPQVILSGLSAVMVAYAIREGIEVLARTSNFLLVILVIFVAFSMMALLDEIKLVRLMPFLENGFIPVIKGLPILVGVMTNLLIFISFIYPSIKKPEKPILKFGGAIIASGIFQGLISVFYIGFYGLRIVSNNVIHPYYNMLRYVDIGSFISGFEAIFIIVWLSSTFFMLSGYLYPVISGAADLFKLKSYKSLIAPILVLAVALSVLIPDPIYNITLYFIMNIYVSIGIGIIIILTFLMVILKKKMGKLKPAKQNAS